MHGYFDARGLKGLPDARKMFVEITEFEDLNMKDETAFLTQVQTDKLLFSALR